MARTNHSYSTEVGKVIFGSLTAGTDLIEGILAECKKQQIHSGMVTCIGSLKEVGYVLFKTENNYPTGYGNQIMIKNPVELMNCTGFICEDENGQLDLHLHGLVTEEDGKISGGHFLKGLNPTLITIEFTIICGNEIKAMREYDEELTFKVINFNK
ncbi:PPC domain-containing DNA-binding protein [Halalkalibacter alkalisediminis]|uniref:PPC domain-containing DNA-binding protein n=1 Tax=Halalkalibacter alkalisediminis TaxID=935616 RepID=A0ABV6NIN3_9BACI|nr:PPC domain-containing DNA-binding protein [Halalkalibacter alkalisediminis]